MYIVHNSLCVCVYKIKSLEFSDVLNVEGVADVTFSLRLKSSTFRRRSLFFPTAHVAELSARCAVHPPVHDLTAMQCLGGVCFFLWQTIDIKKSFRSRNGWCTPSPNCLLNYWLDRSTWV